MVAVNMVGTSAGVKAGVHDVRAGPSKHCRHGGDEGHL